MAATVKGSAQDEVDAMVVFAVDEIIRAVLGEDDIHTVVVERVGSVIRAVLRECADRRDRGGGRGGRVGGAGGRECAERRERGGGKGGFSTGWGGSAGGNEGERRKAWGKKGGLAVPERLRELWLGRSPRALLYAPRMPAPSRRF